VGSLPYFLLAFHIGQGGPVEDLLEREGEMVAARAVIARAKAGSGGVIYLDGPAGIGKTQLLSTITSAAEGLTILRASGGELERDFPFSVVQQLFERVIANDRQNRRSVLAGAGELAAKVFARAADTDSAPPADTTSVLHGLYWLASNVANRNPTALAVDDAHWSDAGSLRWIAYLARRIEDLPLVLLIAARPAEPGSEVDLLDAIKATPGVTLLRPRPLSEAATGMLVRASLGETAGDSFVSACHVATGGNPLFVHELARAMESDGVEPTDSNASRVGRIGPESVARVTVTRLGRMDPAARELARAVAVLGSHAYFARVCSLAALDEQEAGKGADALIEAEVFQGGSPLGFVHPIVRAAIYEDIAPLARSRAHWHAAELLEKAGAPLDEVATHLLACEPAGRANVVSTLVRAGTAALARGAPEAGARYFERALREPPHPVLEAGILLQLGTAEALFGDPAAADHLSRAIDSAPDHAIRSAASLVLSQFLVMAGNPSGSTDVAIAGQKNLPPEYREVGLLLSAMALISGITETDSRVRFEESQSLSNSLTGSTPGEQRLLGALAFEFAMRNRPVAEVIDLATRAARDLENQIASATDPFLVGLPGLAFAVAGQWNEVDEIFGLGLSHAAQIGSRFWYGFLSGARCWANLQRGLLGTAETDALAALEAGEEHGLLLWQPISAGVLAETYIEQDRLDAAEEALERWKTPAMVDPLPVAAFAQFARGRVAFQHRRFEEAARIFEGSGAHLNSGISKTTAFFAWRSSAALCHRALGRVCRAQDLADEELTLARVFGAPRPIGVALRALGLVTGRSDGIALLEESVQELDRAGAQLELSRSLAELGGALRRANQRSRARELLRRALDQAHKLGGEAIASFARDELAALGDRPRTRAFTGIESLTASEDRVARLAVAGSTNREIAQQLFVTLKTVEKHLGNAYAKLQVSSRAELKHVLAAPDAGDNKEPTA